MIINSLLDTDFYKFTMGQLAFHLMPNKLKLAEYSMKCRSEHNLLALKDSLKNEIEHWLGLKLTEDELLYLKNLKINNTYVFKDDYINFLKNIDLKSNIDYKILIENNQLNIRIKGDWKYSIFAEVPILAIVQELYWKKTLSNSDYSSAEKEFEKRLVKKIEYIKETNIKFSEFGTRRRFSFDMQKKAVDFFQKSKISNFVGTSNVLLSKEMNIQVIGSQAHEYFQAMQILSSNFNTSQKEALELWLVEYPDKLKIALTDIFGTDVFLLDFNKELATKYDGLRQDSGIPREVALKYKSHYDNLGIDTKNKTLLFSDDLNFIKANELEKEFGSIFKVMFGIGTFCSNDTGYKPVSIVMKMVRMNNQDVIKVSDTEGKIMCENDSLIKSTKKYIENRKIKGK